jgi:hypothetical protein
MLFYTHNPDIKRYFRAILIFIALFWYAGLWWWSVIMIIDYITSFVLLYFYPKKHKAIEDFLEGSRIYILTAVIVTIMLAVLIIRIYQKTYVPIERQAPIPQSQTYQWY